MDGVIQAPGGPEEDPTGGFKFGDWVAPLADDPVFGKKIGELFGEPFDLLLGRRTYDIFAAHLPYAEGGPYDDIAKTFNRITKYVATRKGADLTWKGALALAQEHGEREGADLVDEAGGEQCVHEFGAALRDEGRAVLLFELRDILSGVAQRRAAKYIS